MSIQFTVLLSLYYKENPLYLRLSLDSIFRQTLLPAEVILVKDGILTEDLEYVLLEYQKLHSSIKVIPLSVNQGLGRALNEGLKYCSNELIARMDTDDIAKPNRFEEQVNFMLTHPEVSVVSAWIEEFEDTVDNVLSVRELPETSDTIYQYGKSRCPINHPVVMFRKSAVLQSGGYQHFPLFEDYYLWVRMLLAGFKFYNLQKSLLYFRTSPEMFERRGGIKYAITEIKLQYIFFVSGYIGFFQMLKNDIIRLFVRLVPNKIRTFIYKRLLR